MKPHNILIASLLALTVTACDSASSTPSPIDDGNNPGDPSTPTSTDSDTTDSPDASGNPEQPGTEPTAPTALTTPAYQGDLSFSKVTTIDVKAFVEQEGLRSVNTSPSLARDGKTARLDVTDDLGYITDIAQVDTDTGTLKWMANDLSQSTHLLFDANNNPVAAVGVACQPASYTPQFDQTLLDISSLIPGDRCITVDTRISANGNVLIFSAYDPETGTEYLAPDQKLYAYTLDTANLVELPDVVLERNGTNLVPRSSGSGRSGYLSDDGTQYFLKMWWEGTDSDGGTVREVGAVLWDTATGIWQMRGLSADLRGCTVTEKTSCLPPYSYVMSNDGMVQYSEVPTDQLFDPASGSPFTTFSTFIEQTGTVSTGPVVLSDLNNSVHLATNNDGSLLLFASLKASDAMPVGFNLYKPETGTSVSLNRALNACPEFDESGNTIDIDDCLYTSVPVSITNDAVTFMADGRNAVIRSVSRFDIDIGQVVEGFIVDVDTGGVFSFPENFSSDPTGISANASVFLGNAGYPDYDLLIGRR